MEPNSQDVLARAQRLAQEACGQQIADDSRDRLKRIAAKKITTGFIYSLAEFEKVFGLELWGHGLPDEELTAAQKANRGRWEHVRVAILDNGNTQRRALAAELDLHDIEFRGYQVVLRGRGNGKQTVDRRGGPDSEGAFQA